MNREPGVTIGDVAETIRGVTYEKADARSSPCQGYSPLIRATNIDQGMLVLDSFVYVPDVIVRSDQRLHVGDIVLAASSGSLSVVGKAALLRSQWQGTFGAFCYAVRPQPDRVVPDYLAHFMQTSAYRSRVSNLAAGVNINNLRREHIESVELPYCALDEQRRIVEAIDSYFSRLDDAVASLERVQARLKAYRASVLKAAVEGRLVPTEASLARTEKRDYEPADILLARILVERRRCWEEAELAKLKAAGKTAKDDKWKRKYKDASPINVPDLGATSEALPVGWCWASVGQMAWSVRDGPHYSPIYENEGVPFITGGQVRPWGVDFDAAKRISPDVHRKLSIRVLPEFGDILYTKGGTTGIARVNTYRREFSVWVHVAVLKLASPINPFYLQHALNSPWCYTQAQGFTHGVGNQDLGLTRMVKIVFPLPPRDEQDRIVDEVERLDSIARESASLVDTQVQRVRTLRQAVLKWAFEGKLAEKSPSEDSADALRARIRAERVVSVPMKKSRGRPAKGTT